MTLRNDWVIFFERESTPVLISVVSRKRPIFYTYSFSFYDFWWGYLVISCTSFESLEQTLVMTRVLFVIAKKILVKLSVSTYTRWMIVFLMDPWTISRLSPHHLTRRGSVAEKVKPCMDLWCDILRRRSPAFFFFLIWSGFPRAGHSLSYHPLHTLHQIWCGGFALSLLGSLLVVSLPFLTLALSSWQYHEYFFLWYS